MKQHTEILQVRITVDMRNWLYILETKYRVKKCEFVRKAIIEKFKRDTSKLRLKKDSEKNYCPF